MDEARAGELAALEVEGFQLLEVFEVNQAGVAQLRRVHQAEFSEVLESFEKNEPGIGDSSRTEIERAQGSHCGQAGKPGVVDLGQTQVQAFQLQILKRAQPDAVDRG